MSPEETAEALRQHFGEDVTDVVRFRGEVSAVISKRRLLEACLLLRDGLKYRFLSDLTAVDWLDRTPRFDVVYHVTNIEDWVRFRLKVQTAEGESVPTVCSVWPAANWAEREVWDLFGVEFSDHPDLRRIQLPEGWIGHPLRKDFAQSQISLPRPKSDKTVS